MAAPGTIRPLVKSFGCCGFVIWVIIAAVFVTFYVGEYINRPDEQKSFWKAGVWGIWCVGAVFGTAAGITAFLFMIFNTIRDKIDGD